MTDQKHCGSALPQFLHPCKAFVLKLQITHGKSFIDQDDFTLDIYCDSKSEAGQHPAGIHSHRSIEPITEFRKFFYVRKLGLNLSPRQSHYRSQEPDILPAGEFHI